METENNEETPQTNTISSQVDLLEKMLDKYEADNGLKALTEEDEVTKEARKILEIRPSDLLKMNAQDCGGAAFVLGQYSYRVQQAMNRQQSRATAASESIKKIIAKKINNYKGYSFEERKLQAINDDEAAKKWENIRINSQLRIDRLSFLSNKLSDLSKTLLSIQNSKRGIRD